MENYIEDQYLLDLMLLMFSMLMKSYWLTFYLFYRISNKIFSWKYSRNLSKKIKYHIYYDGIFSKFYLWPSLPHLLNNFPSPNGNPGCTYPLNSLSSHHLLLLSKSYSRCSKNLFRSLQLLSSQHIVLWLGLGWNPQRPAYIRNLNNWKFIFISELEHHQEM